MIVVRLTGGLGNQLHQYAAALRLAKVNHTSLKLDVASYARDPRRHYGLDALRITASVADSSEIAMFQGRERLRRLTHRLYQSLPSSCRRWQWVMQPSLRFFPHALEFRGDIYLDGSWQSERYFKDIESELRVEFALRDDLADRNESVAKQIASVPAVSMHVRRGDYVVDPATRSIHQVCSLAYYERAVELLTQMEPEARVFVFSDDPRWARDNIRLPVPVTIVDYNPPDRAHEDLCLMSLCQHHIVANSSLSWWGAWLARRDDKKVFAPRRWFNVGDYDIADIVPATWQLVDV